MENNELMMLMACRHAVVSKIQEGNSEFAHQNDEDEWDTVPYREVVDWLDEQIKKQNWIPTSERQPEKNGNYLAFYRSGDSTATIEFMMVDHCNAGGGWLHEESGRKFLKKVIAWMPLPEPYKAERELQNEAN